MPPGMHTGIWSRRTDTDTAAGLSPAMVEGGCRPRPAPHFGCASIPLWFLSGSSFTRSNQAPSRSCMAPPRHQRGSAPPTGAKRNAPRGRSGVLSAGLGGRNEALVAATAPPSTTPSDTPPLSARGRSDQQLCRKKRPGAGTGAVRRIRRECGYRGLGRDACGNTAGHPCPACGAPCMLRGAPALPVRCPAWIRAVLSYRAR